ncbi:unnamed protein product [Larinioides sclopetarius]|uniref:BTB domain-containing protein n=1 Tax=Larinioides sclopetarius TaxID=280406 RepID=A0AAV2BTY5_9ARAC
MISYIYTDKVGDLQWQSAADLYKAADRFELLDLKELCANFLDSALSLSNFWCHFGSCGFAPGPGIERKSLFHVNMLTSLHPILGKVLERKILNKLGK